MDPRRQDILYSFMMKNYVELGGVSITKRFPAFAGSDTRPWRPAAICWMWDRGCLASRIHVLFDQIPYYKDMALAEAAKLRKA